MTQRSRSEEALTAGFSQLVHHGNCASNKDPPVAFVPTIWLSLYGSLTSHETQLTQTLTSSTDLYLHHQSHKTVMEHFLQHKFNICIYDNEKTLSLKTFFTNKCKFQYSSSQLYVLRKYSVKQTYTNILLAPIKMRSRSSIPGQQSSLRPQIV